MRQNILGKNMNNRLSLALCHYPVVDRHDNIYTTAITNMDVHDIARSCATFGLRQYYVISPITAQRELASTMANFWVSGSGNKRNKDRAAAMSLVSVQSSLSDCLEREQEISGQKPLLIATSAKLGAKPSISYEEGADLIKGSSSTVLVFGTGWGLAPEILEMADMVLDPIHGAKEYNHLSVRSAAAIIMDRLTFGRATCG
jgi:tRNA (guanine37-N1)-methyltransferase